MHHHMKGHCHSGCQRRPIVCPMQECVMDQYFVENQDYIHPTHILVQNHHLLNNYHYFPYLVSQANDFQTQDYAFPQGSSPDYDWMNYMEPQMNPQGMGPQGMMPQGMSPMQMGMAPGAQAPMMGAGQMPMMGPGQMPMMMGNDMMND
ncbi:hypothetical protein EQV77_03155 [Halobacillus fulvus]|nr:hypothetical protein EQV77_03155 [Halobacillus fulvus]